MTQRLANKIAIITGAGSGIGRAAAELFAREGAYLILADTAEAVEVRRGLGPRRYDPAAHI